MPRRFPCWATQQQLGGQQSDTARCAYKSSSTAQSARLTTESRAGRNAFTVFEKGSDVGGVWRENRYPGAACDSPANLYSYSFEQHDRSTRRYASQPEILDYLRRCARKHGIESHLKLGTEITHVSFDADAQVWRLRSASGDEHRARALVTASGQLSHPSLPSIAGRADPESRAEHPI